MNKTTCAVVGFGRFGQLLAKLLNEDFSVVISEINQTNIALAKEHNYKVVSLKEAATADTLFLTIPISNFESVVKKLAKYVDGDNLVIDTCSVKIYPTELMKKYLINTEILGTHPLFGPDSVKNGLRGRKMVFCPLTISQTRLDFWSNYWKAKGLEVIQTSPKEHDKVAAYSQGITHFIGRVLSEMKLKSSAIATKGYEELLAIIEQTNNDSWQLFYDLQHYNPYSKDMRDVLAVAINKVGEKLDEALRS